MSIIHDALKKVQRNFVQDRSNKAPLPDGPQAGSHGENLDTKKAQHSRGRQQTKHTVIPTHLLFSPPTSPNSRSATQRQIRTPGHHSSRFWIFVCGLICVGLIAAIMLLSRFFVQSHQETPDPFADIVVKGIMTQGDKNLVLINDGIYEIGETVAGMRIVGISLNNVHVLMDGKLHALEIQTDKPSENQTP